MTEGTAAPEKKRSFESLDTVVSKVEILTPRVKGIRFQYEPGHFMDFKAGQFAQVFIPAGDKIKRTSYSIASSPHNSEYFELCVTLVPNGVSSTFLHTLKVGDKVKAMGPLGRFTMPEPLPRDVVFVATGSGIAPFRSMIHELIDKKTNKNIYLVFGNRFEEDIIYKSEWDEMLKANNNFKALFTLSKPSENWKGKKGYVQDAVGDFVPEPEKKDFYICGLVKMIDSVVEKLTSLGVSKDQIHFERYD
jgi:ferredoxin-NADP reductase